MNLTSFDGWEIVGHCPRCGAPIWAIPNRAPRQGPGPHVPRTEGACTCFSTRPNTGGKKPEELQEGEPG